jgi:6-phosphogluconolactonase
MAAIEMIEGASDAEIAEWLHRRLQARLVDRRRGVAITVPGGSTPFPILRALASLPLEWERITVWPGDDREVPEDHPASNTGRIRALLEPVGAEVVPLSLTKPVPRFALAWLGMGNDGHVASLFPASDPRLDDPQPIRRLTPDPLPPEAPFDRITLTLPSLLASEELLFVIRGADKQRLFEAALRGDHDWPVTRVLKAATQPVTCFT